MRSEQRRAHGSLPLRPVLLVLLTVPLAACDWFIDSKRQPSLTVWETWRADSLAVRGQPAGSVPTTGTFMPAWGVSYNPLPGTIDSLAAIANPTPVSEGSLANGRKHYEINCAPCHGDMAAGDGMATKYGMVPMTLMSDIMKAQRTDGYIYGMIRNGRGLMPSYARIEEMDRWDVVNYVRALQGKVTDVKFSTGPLAPPGVTGAMVPGASRLGPTRPSHAAPAALSPTARPLAAHEPPAGEKK